MTITAGYTILKIGNITSGPVTGQLVSFVAFTMQYLGGEQAPEIPVNAGPDLLPRWHVR